MKVAEAEARSLRSTQVARIDSSEGTQWRVSHLGEFSYFAREREARAECARLRKQDIAAFVAGRM